MVEAIKIAAQKTDNLPEPKKGSNYRKIYDANQLLINGVETVSSSVSQLSSSLKTISGGQAKVGTAIKLLAQKDELSSALNHALQGALLSLLPSLTLSCDAQEVHQM